MQSSYFTIDDRRGFAARVPLLWAAASVAAAGGTVGAGLINFPNLTRSCLFAIGGIVSAFVLISSRRIIPAFFLTSVGFLLAGYALFGKSFAYIGVAPAYIGEVVLLFGIVAIFASGSLPVLMRSGVTWMLLSWSVWGAIRTVPFVATYGADALRDGALWGYSAFALAVAGCVYSTRSAVSVTSRYGRWVTLLVTWLPIALIMTRLTAERTLNMPGTSVPLFTMKGGDAGVHLAGAGVFVLAGLCAGSPGDTRNRAGNGRLFWVLWLFALVCVASLNRGGFVAVTGALFLASTLAPIAIGRRVAAAAAVAMLVAGLMLAVVENTSYTEPLEEREISPRQVVENVFSIVGRDSARINLAGTKEWRLEWWSKIIDYTIRGPYFWSGKGFGINLADDDGYQLPGLDDAPLRSPHNGHLTVLARMGVPGLVLWVLLQLSFGCSLLRAYLRARHAGAEWWARVDLWVLAYWFAFLVNASFDVSLEGPMAGIWFWCVVGFGIAVVQLQRAEVQHGPIRLDTLIAPAHSASVL